MSDANDNQLDIWIKADADGLLKILPCKIGGIVYALHETMPYDYLAPEDGYDRYIKCEVISIRYTKTGDMIKLKALYPSRMCKKQYLTYSSCDFGTKIFNSKDEAKKFIHNHTRFTYI